MLLYFCWLHQTKCTNIREKGSKSRYKYVFITDITTLQSYNIFQKIIKNLKIQIPSRTVGKPTKILAYLILDMLLLPNKLAFIL